MSKKLTQIAVLSDTHIHSLAELPAGLIEVLQKADAIFHLGDFVRMELIEYLKSLNSNFYGVYGNHDPQYIKRMMPRAEMVEVNGKRMGLFHGYWFPFFTKERIKAIFRKDKVDAIIYGHTHVIRNEIIDDILFFNPGSATAQWPAPWKTYGLLKIDEQIKGQVVSFAEKDRIGISKYVDAVTSRESVIRLACGAQRNPDFGV